ncbi:hypothetical protein BWD12_19710 [Leptospira santarosai serovar Bananal]|uniref:hypothetical protein n=1 Tax=Leptospira santarosai TaxID=28183 RepID=UPI0009617413|nr:hypothetical protein [Leptospira santarosai]OLY59961.1 hypothetical protein BV917_13215 [Leptospira santarosai serovar Guaricura]ONF75996.1 hypothetical protein BWD12_19710 [Leptospira santarosai serovar Bananal]
MCKRNSKIIIGCLVFILQVYCISIPEKLPNESDRCISNYFQVRREVRAISNRTEFVNSMIIGYSSGFVLFAGPGALVLLVGVPMNQFVNKDQADRIIEVWHNRQCEVNL